MALHGSYGMDVSMCVTYRELACREHILLDLSRDLPGAPHDASMMDELQPIDCPLKALKGTVKALDGTLKATGVPQQAGSAPLEAPSVPHPAGSAPLQATVNSTSQSREVPLQPAPAPLTGSTADCAHSHESDATAAR